MQALRLARPRAPLRRSLIVRSLATTANPTHAHVATASSAPSATTTRSQQSIIPLSNVEAQWEKLSQEEQITVHSQLEALQKKDWKTLSIDEKKAAYYVAFGPHGPRAPVSPPGQNLKVFLSTMGLIGIAGIIYAVIRAYAPPPPRTLTKEWQEASNERAIEQKMNPITGISSEGYKGKGFVTHK
ncbi:hypothetical protein PILCRDRAFT_816394 [Piloderma croceum F 1598]|uniref:Cytochrome c oxidase subunit IV n=1 Tax=Piloderma croceum (strain F 1598) TaxID=765440 RepID=A0A0C3FQM1_PILCF|nr:hypothetical protein PILCRDRAFT_816394 [Piloderma croceum F 1598]